MLDLDFVAREACIVGYSFVQSATDMVRLVAAAHVPVVLDAIAMPADIVRRLHAHQHKKSARLRALP